MHSKKSNSIQIILSLVALLVIFAVAIGVTYSWIEGGTTYSMKTENDTDVKTGALSDNLNNQTILLSPSGSGTADLDLTYDKTSSDDYQDLLFTPVSSANGRDFFIPIAYDEVGSPKTYRAANTNDIGTKFISYKFDVKANEKCYIAFNGQPVFNTNNNAAFRYMISDGTTSRVFSGSNEVITTEGVSNVNGTTSDLVTEKTDSYVYNSSTTQNRLFEFTSGQTKTIEMSVWLDSASVTDALYSSDVSFQINFVVGSPLYKYGINARTLNASGVAVSNGFTGGSIKVGSSTYNAAQSNLTCVEGSSVTLTAVPKTGYDFMGWYSDSSYTTRVSSNLEYKPTPTNGKVYYALFKEATSKVTTIYVEPRTGFTDYNLYVYNDKVGDTTIHYSGSWPGTTLALDTETNFYYKYTFETTNTGQFYAIISDTDGANQYPAQNSDGLMGDIGGTYIFTSGNELIAFNPDKFYTTTVQSTGNGTAKVNGGSSTKTRIDNVVTLTATPNSGYGFKGWYTDESCTTLLSSNATYDLYVSGTNTYYAKFVKAYTVTVYSVYNNTTTASTTGGTVAINDGAYGSSATASVNSGGEATLRAKVKTGYVFDGWYTDTTFTSRTGTASAIRTTNVTSNKVRYARFLKTYSLTAHAVTDGTTDSSTGGTVTAGSSAAGATSNATVNYGTNITYVASAKTNYTFEGWYDAATGGNQLSTDTSYTVAAQSSKTNVYARFTKNTKTLYVGVISYQKDNINQVYYWCETSASGTIDLSSATTKSYSVGNSYWSNAAQTFYCYAIEVPKDVQGIKFKNSSNKWFGNDVTDFESGKIDLIFEYGGSYINYRATY